MILFVLIVWHLVPSYGAVPKTLFSSARIVGGAEIDITQVPYQLAYEWNGYLICGASILADTWALTAAHCVEGTRAEDGQVRTASSQVAEGGAIYQVDNIIPHEKYNHTTRDYDVALVQLQTPIQWGPGSQAIKLTTTEPAAGERVFVSGWGTHDQDGADWPKVLFSIDIPVVDRDQCGVSYSEQGGITPRMFCAGEEGKSACIGDTGGPVVLADKLVGVVSSGKGCAQKDFPDIYINIADPEISDFITRNMKNMK